MQARTKPSQNHKQDEVPENESSHKNEQTRKQVIPGVALPCGFLWTESQITYTNSIRTTGSTTSDAMLAVRTCCPNTSYAREGCLIQSHLTCSSVGQALSRQVTTSERARPQRLPCLSGRKGASASPRELLRQTNSQTRLRSRRWPTASRWPACHRLPGSSRGQPA